MWGCKSESQHYYFIYCTSTDHLAKAGGKRRHAEGTGNPLSTILHSLTFPCVLKLAASQTEALALLANQEGQDLSVKLDIHFIHSPTREIQIYFRSSMAKSRMGKFKLLFPKLSFSMKYIKVRRTLRPFICFCGFIL